MNHVHPFLIFMSFFDFCASFPSLLAYLPSPSSSILCVYSSSLFQDVSFPQRWYIYPYRVTAIFLSYTLPVRGVCPLILAHLSARFCLRLLCAFIKKGPYTAIQKTPMCYRLRILSTGTPLQRGKSRRRSPSSSLTTDLCLVVTGVHPLCFLFLLFPTLPHPFSVFLLAFDLAFTATVSHIR